MADQVKLRKRLENLFKIPANQMCVDCNKRGPRWASANLGIFVCIECSGIHRNLGVHISFVRSVNLDSWTEKQVAVMEEWGNGRANEYYEANVPSNVRKPTEGDSTKMIERYIRDKYEHKKFIASSIPPRSQPEAAAAGAPTTRRQQGAPVPVPIHAPVIRQTPAVVSVVQEASSLIDFLDDPPAAYSAAVPRNDAGMNDFGSFASSSAFAQDTLFGNFESANPPAPQQQNFSSFDSARPQQQQQQFQQFASADPFQQHQFPPQNTQMAMHAPTPAPVQASKPQASADSIMALYKIQDQGNQQGQGMNSGGNMRGGSMMTNGGGMMNGNGGMMNGGGMSNGGGGFPGMMNQNMMGVAPNPMMGGGGQMQQPHFQQMQQQQGMMMGHHHQQQQQQFMQQGQGQQGNASYGMQATQPNKFGQMNQMNQFGQQAFGQQQQHQQHQNGAMGGMGMPPSIPSFMPPPVPAYAPQQQQKKDPFPSFL